ncbi:MAG: alpha/beta hydrolase [Candidatus Saccharimonadales bacterium]
MKNAILLHGKPSKEEYYNSSLSSCSNYHWFPWLQKQLLVNDIKADTPEVPYAFDPEWSLWVKEIERFDIYPETTLVGHSCGGGFWVRYLSENKKIKVGKVILVAPSLNPEKTWGEVFFDFIIDPAVQERVGEIVIFNSVDDSKSIQESVKIIRKVFPKATYREFTNMGHFTKRDMDSSEFPELLEEIMK